jgi:hypothetical protein
MKNLIKKTFPLFLVVSFVFVFSVDSVRAACMSCTSMTGRSSSELACDGDSKFEVFTKCGEPDFTEEAEEIKSGVIGPGGFSAVKERVERLYYNCGQGRFIKVLIFRNGRLVEIQDDGRGYGEKQRCW